MPHTTPSRLHELWASWGHETRSPRSRLEMQAAGLRFIGMGALRLCVLRAPLALRPARCTARHPVRGRSVPPRGTRRFVTLWGLRQTAAGAFAASDAAGLVGPHGDLDAVSGAELSREAGEVGLDGARGDVELAGDLVVGAALGYRHEDFLLAGSERFYRLPRW